MEAKYEEDNEGNACKQPSEYKRKQRQLLEMINLCVEIYLDEVLPRLPQTYIQLFQMILSKALVVLALHGVNISYEQEQNKHSYLVDLRQITNDEQQKDNYQLFCFEVKAIETLREKLSEKSKILVVQVINLLKQCEQFSEAAYFSEKIQTAVSFLQNKQLSGQQEKEQGKQYSFSSEKSSPRQVMSDPTFVGYDIVYFEGVLGQFVEEAIKALEFIVNQQGPYIFRAKHSFVLKLLTMLSLLKANNFLASSELLRLEDYSLWSLDYLQKIIAQTNERNQL